MKTNITRNFIALSAFALLGLGKTAHADFLDLNTLTPGSTGGFTGSLNGISVNGAISTTTPNFILSAIGTTYYESTIDNSSPQYSYANVFSPTKLLTDRVGYTSFSGTFNPATITIKFGSPVTNPVFHVANLDSMQYDFAPTAGLGGLVLLNGNGGGGDGILVAGTVISDADPTTIIGIDPADTPTTSGPRSAYGSIELTGTFSSLVFNVSNPNSNGDGGSFTLSAAAVPEPGSIALFVGLASVGASLLRKRRK